jgi:spore protease
MSFRTDLALEAVENVAASGNLSSIDGVGTIVKDKKGAKITVVEIKTKEASEKVGKPIGRYTTIEMPPFSVPFESFQSYVEIIAEEIAPLLPNDPTVLVAGLGNISITPDSLGPRVSDKILATRHIDSELKKQIGLGGLPNVCSVATGVLGKTGIESEEIIKSIVDSVGANCVIAVDALAAGSIKRLGKTVQISNSGISPGSGVQNKRKEISSRSLKIESVVSIGIPTVTEASVIASEMSEGKVNECENMIVTPKEIDAIIANASRVLSLAINKALFRELDIDDLDHLTS